MTDSPQSFAGLDAGRVGDVVSAVWEHRDDVAAAAAFVRDHGDDVLDVLGRLPDLLASAAGFLDGAAQNARSAATFLTGDPAAAGSPDAGGVRGLAETAGQALERCRDEFTAAREMLERLGAELDGVPIPDVRPTYSDVLGHRIVTGLDLGTGRLLAPAGEQVREGAARFAGIGDELARVADLLRRIGDLVSSAGGGLAGTADQLADGGRALARFASPGGIGGAGGADTAGGGR